MRIRPDRMDQAIRIFQRSIIPEVKKQHGNLGFFVMENRELNELLVMSHWETERDMLASERNDSVDQQIAKLSTVLSEPPTGVTYKMLLPQ